jgi:multiple sugar transport system permease protein
LATQATFPPGSKPHGVLWRLRRSSPLALIYAASVSIFYAVIFVVPFGTAIWLSFQNWDFLLKPKFVGLRNYVKLFTSSQFWQALKVTVVFSVVEISLGVGLALLLALMLSRMKGKWERLFLSLYYLPYVIPVVVSVYLWRWLYNPTGGAFNTVLASFGLPQQPFLASGNQALWCITVMVIWIYVGSAAVILLTGIKDVPDSLFDAAKIDGAGFWQTFFKIIMPLIRPVLVYQIVVSVIGTMQMFEPFFLMGGPGWSTRTLSLYTYQLGFVTLNLGFGAAVSLVIFLILLFATVFQLQRWQITWEY